MDFESRYAALNDSQKKAVTKIDGPLMVVAGPGTGKTELLSMRTANILRQTDTLPENILCLTFTESGAAAMRERLTSIIGADAYKVAIHTFHSFGSEIMNHHRQFFYGGSEFRPSDDLSSYEIIRDILDELPYDNPLAAKMNDEYAYLRDILTSISELKRSGLTSDELLQVLDANEAVLDGVETKFSELFSSRISSAVVPKLEPLSVMLAETLSQKLPPSIVPLANTMALSLAHAIDEAKDTESTKPITAWKTKWFTKNEMGTLIFKDRSRHVKLRSLSYVYFQYLNRMQESSLYDFDDMILRVVHALEVFPELRYNLQEKYLYIMVDEFQDTNLAQARILSSLTAVETGDAPNIMVVGDDDQAIYSFQGAEVRNILHFKSQYEGAELVVLTDNYRSAETVLTHSRSVITIASDRLENYEDALDKSLTAHTTPKDASVELHEYHTVESERSALAKEIARRISAGTAPESIAVIARRHYELESLLPYLAKESIDVTYERRDNVLDLEIIRTLTLVSTIVMLLAEKRLDEADELLPELLAHPAWHILPEELWKLSLTAHKGHTSWLDQMSTIPRFTLIHTWLVSLAQRSHSETAEVILDVIMGTPEDKDSNEVFVSPFYAHYFADSVRESDFDSYLTCLEALRAIRTKIKEYKPNQTLLIADFVEFIELHKEIGSTITSVRLPSDEQKGAVNLMTAHKSKGLEFDHVFIIGAVDSMWGEKARSRSRLLSYPANLPLSPSGDSLDERIRLFYVAMTRAKSTLTISFSKLNEKGKPTLPASFLINESWAVLQNDTPVSAEERLEHVRLEWRDSYTSLPKQSMQAILAPQLERYKLSATHLNAFLDVSRGGPRHFLLQNILRFPQSMSPNAAYGSAVHKTLQRTHAHLQVHATRRPLEDILADFEKNLTDMHLGTRDHTEYLNRGTSALTAFLTEKYETFSENDIPELSFSLQQSRLGTAHLTGALDVVRVDAENKTIIVTDYKTGSPSASWTGKTDYEKQKLHKYKQQLMFYKLLVEHSRDFANFTVEKGVLQFVEPSKVGTIHNLELTFDEDDMMRFRRLVLAVWERITKMDFIDTSSYSEDYRGMLTFEASLLDDNV